MDSETVIGGIGTPGVKKGKRPSGSVKHTQQPEVAPDDVLLPGIIADIDEAKGAKMKETTAENMEITRKKRFKKRIMKTSVPTDKTTQDKKESVSSATKEKEFEDAKVKLQQDREKLKGKTVEVPENVCLIDLAKHIKVDLSELEEITEKLSDSIGVTVVDEFQPLRKDLIELICIEFETNHKIIEKPAKVLKKRPPVITIMGHVDHGKTTLLDAFRDSNIVDSEYGAITQSTAAFSFQTEKGNYITFIDTPGHEVFDAMRVRGAKATDFVIVVISAVEGKS